jgi:hypothetical protein
MERSRLVLTLSLLSFSAVAARADLIASFSSFTHTDNVSAVATNSAATPSWTTSSLLDKAGGTGALSAGVQTVTNRQAFSLTNNNFVTSGTASDLLFVSNNRENPSSTTATTTWFEFDVAPTSASLDFTGQSATLDTYAFRSITTSSGGNWALFFSTNGGASFTQIGMTQTGASATTQSGGTAPLTINGPTSLTYDLTPIGVVNSGTTVRFRLDPVASGAFNGATSQRSIGFDNLNVNATVLVPEPSALAFVVLGALGLLVRRHRAK